MQDVSQDLLDAVSTGSFSMTLRVDAWYDGEIVLEDAPAISASVSQDRTRAIHGDATMIAACEDESLVPRSWSDPLATYGQVLQVRAGVRWGGGSEDVSLGWYRIDQSTPAEWWTEYADAAGVKRLVCRGTQVTTQCSDLMSGIDDDRFLVGESPASLASVKDEIRRLARDHVPIADLDHVTDATIPASVVYQTSRVGALQDLAAVLGCWAVMGADGALTLRPLLPSDTPVWTVSVTEKQILDWDRSLTRADMYNAVISTGATSDGTPVQGMALEPSGPLRYGGPFGRIPFGHSSPLITSATAAQTDADSRLARLIRERVARVTIALPANPALELGDTIGVQLPDKHLTGQVHAITWAIPEGTMRVVVTVPRAQIWGA